MMNPPHLGHLALVDAVLDACGLDRVAVVPAGIPPHRREPDVSARARLTMAVRAFADLDHLVVSDTEVERGEDGEPGYMVDTVEEMREMPAMLGYDDLVVEAWLIVGADQAASLPSWHRWERLREIAHVAVVRRPDQIADPALDEALRALARDHGADTMVVDMPPIGISSTMVREFAAHGDRATLVNLVPAAIVEDVLRLYGTAVTT